MAELVRANLCHDARWQKQSLLNVGILSHALAAMWCHKGIPLASHQTKPFHALFSTPTGNNEGQAVDMCDEFHQP